MPVNAFTEFIVNYTPAQAWLPYVGGTLVTAVILRKWAAGPRNSFERNLHGRLFILTGAFEGVGLIVLRSLAERGAQVIALTPEPSDPTIQQLLYLLRSETRNELLYAEKCDPSSLTSVRDFCTLWGTKAVKKGMMSELGPTRIDSVVFCHDEGLLRSIRGIGQARKTGKDSGSKVELYHQVDCLSRFLLVKLLLPSLLRSSEEGTVRLINVVSPVYAAADFDEQDQDWTRRKYPSMEPWRADGAASLRSICLWLELQAKLNRLSSPSPSSKEGSSKTAPPKLDPESPLPLPTPSSIICVSVCPGFLRSSFSALVGASLSSPAFNFFGLLFHFIFFPLIWLLTKSSEDGAQSVLHAILAPVDFGRGGGRVPNPNVDGTAADGVGEKVEGGETGKVRKGGVDGNEGKKQETLKPGRIFRDCREIYVPRSEVQDPTLCHRLWEAETKLCDDILKNAPPKKDAETGGDGEGGKSSGRRKED